MPPTTAATLFTVAACAGFGLVIGSFLNVVIYRAPRGQSVVTPASRCPRCGTALGGWENVPVASWLALRGRCRHCGEPISIRYPIVEAVVGGSFATLGWAVGPAAALGPILVVCGATAAAAAIDLDGLAIPRMVLVADLVGGLGLLVVSLVEHGAGRLGWAAVGAALTAIAGFVTCRHPAGKAIGRLTTAALLGWVAGWLWPAGGIIVAGLTALAGVAVTVAVRRARHQGGAVTPAAEGATVWPTASWLLAVATCSFGVLVAGAALRGP
jgi:leader peptidase (prepilin peptidase)/N-methyltransferase